MVAFQDVKAYAAEIYDVETRPKKVADTLLSLGAEKVLAKVGLVENSEKIVGTVAAMTTVAGLLEKKDAAMEIAAPYIAKARDAEGRKELAEEIVATETFQSGKALLNEKVVEPVSARISASKEFAAPYVASAKEYADPYVAKLTELRNSERVESMIVAFQQAREHPAEKVGELRAKAVDLIKYENIRAYRDHVMSAEFQADTIQLVKVDLPAIAASAAKRGAENVKATATTMKEEVDKYSEKIAALVPSEVEIKAAALKLKETGAALLVELQAELASGVSHVKAEGFSLDDAIERLKRVVAIVDKKVVSPLIASAKVMSVDVTDASVTGEEAEEDEPMQDAEEPEEE
jgi:hypothetical protein